MLKRIKLIVAYDGTNYCGWQVQPNGITVEEVLNKALSRLLQEDIKIIGASRTDSGVHALGNVAVFDTKARMPAEKISYALNQFLPEDIKIQKSEEVALDFHPRYRESQKTYCYDILNTEFLIPTQRLYSYFYYRKLNIEEMQKACAYIIGEHDFKSFCSAKAQVKTTVRTIYDLMVEKKESHIYVTVRGNGFLYNMVRILVGTLLEVGLGKIKPEQVGEIIEAKDRKNAGPSVPPEGLTLVKIDYLSEMCEQE